MGSRFRSEIFIRPSDIDSNGHVHNSIYLDYVSQARFEQMERDYQYPMEKFVVEGFSWVVKSVQIDYKRPLRIKDKIWVDTWVDAWDRYKCTVCFEILFQKNNKVAANGYFVYTLIDIKNARLVPIPDRVIDAYSI